jgi:pimeloyl-ACP methyl ester carboxylesterase
MKYRVQGTGPNVLFVHGIPTSGRLWDYVISELQSSFTCIVVDLPGLGESVPLPDKSLDPVRYAQELEILREQLELPSWHIVGHDAGSAIAVHYASLFSTRVDRLVLCSPPIFPEFKIPWIFRPVRIALLGDGLAPLILALLWHGGIQWAIGSHNASLTQIIQAFRYPFSGRSGRRHFVHLLRWGDPAQVLARTAALLPDLSVPTLICHGKQDNAIPLDFAYRASKIIPNAKLCLMDCGHFLPLSCPEILYKHLFSFLTKVDTFA